MNNIEYTNLITFHAELLPGVLYQEKGWLTSRPLQISLKKHVNHPMRETFLIYFHACTLFFNQSRDYQFTYLSYQSILDVTNHILVSYHIFLCIIDTQMIRKI